MYTVFVSKLQEISPVLALFQQKVSFLVARRQFQVTPYSIFRSGKLL